MLTMTADAVAIIVSVCRRPFLSLVGDMSDNAAVVGLMNTADFGGISACGRFGLVAPDLDRRCWW